MTGAEKADARPGRGSTSKKTPTDGADLERRVARLEFAEGALSRLRVPIRVDAEAGRDVLTDIDVFTVDIDGRLGVRRSILECKSGKGQAGEPDRLLWLSGLRNFLGFERGVLVRQTVSTRGRAVARALGLQVMDVSKLKSREAAHEWLPARFAHIDGEECATAESRADRQLKDLGHIPSELVAFLRFSALRADSGRSLGALQSLGTAIASGAALPRPTAELLAGHGLMALLMAAIQDASRLDEMSRSELHARTVRQLTVGTPDDDHLLEVLGRADDVVRLVAEAIHSEYTRGGAARLPFDVPSLRALVGTPPHWVDRYVDLTESLRDNPAVARELLQTAELCCFEALLGGNAHEAKAFNHLFSVEHRHLLRVAVRCLAHIVGQGVEGYLAPVLALDFERSGVTTADRRNPHEARSTLTERAQELRRAGETPPRPTDSEHLKLPLGEVIHPKKPPTRG